MKNLSKETIKMMRAWAAECQWDDIEGPSDLDELSDQQIIRGIAKHYAGGVEQFLRDGEGH